MRNSLIAVSLMIVPLLLAAAINYWPFHENTRPISSVIVLPSKVNGTPDQAFLADEVSTAVSKYLARSKSLEIRTPPSSIQIEPMKGDFVKIADAYGVSVIVLTAITIDAGIFELDLRALDPRTGHTIWTNGYQSPRSSYDEMIRAASDALERALENGS